MERGGEDFQIMGRVRPIHYVSENNNPAIIKDEIFKAVEIEKLVVVL